MERRGWASGFRHDAPTASAGCVSTSLGDTKKTSRA